MLTFNVIYVTYPKWMIIFFHLFCIITPFQEFRHIDVEETKLACCTFFVVQQASAHKGNCMKGLILFLSKHGNRNLVDTSSVHVCYLEAETVPIEYVAH